MAAKQNNKEQTRQVNLIQSNLFKRRELARWDSNPVSVPLRSREGANGILTWCAVWFQTAMDGSEMFKNFSIGFCTSCAGAGQQQSSDLLRIGHSVGHTCSTPSRPYTGLGYEHILSSDFLLCWSFFFDLLHVRSSVYYIWNLLSSIRVPALLKLLRHRRQAQLRRDRTFTSLCVVTSVWHDGWHHSDAFPTSLQRGKLISLLFFFFMSVAICAVVSGVNIVKWRACWDPVITSGVLLFFCCGG